MSIIIDTSLEELVPTFHSWGQGIKDKDWLKTNGTEIVNNQFEVTEVGDYSVYYVMENYYDFVETFKVTQEQLPAPPSVVYGVKLNTAHVNPEVGLTYIDDATGFTRATGNNGAFNYGSWQDKFPFNQIKPCVLKNGVVNYYLNPNDYTKKLDGSNADITSGADGDVMVEFPKIYWKFETIGTDLYIRYSNTKVDAGYKCYAHTRGTEERDKIYISAYMGHELTSKVRSLSGKVPTSNRTISQFRTNARANGSGYEQMAYYQLLMLQVLFIIMFKNRDSQTALGKGYVESNPTRAVTGGANTKGLFYGETSGKLQNKFCGIEDFWGNAYYWIDGLFSDTLRNILISNNNTGFNDTGSGYFNTGLGTASNTNGYITKVQGTTETGFIVQSVLSGSATTYFADQAHLYASALPVFGGNEINSTSAGAFKLLITHSSTTYLSDISGRLSYY